MPASDVVVIRAGPYGLSAAVHWHTFEGLGLRVSVEPLSFWSRNMPRDMFRRFN